MIDIENLNKDYGKISALKNINLSLEDSRVVGLLGPNGSGKTTLIKILTGMISHYSGTVLIDGNKIGPKTKSIVSYLPDQLYYEKWMKVLDLRNSFANLFDDFLIDKFDNLVEKFQIRRDEYIYKLSKGNQEKLQLALALSRNAKVFIFDEPIGGVDPALRVLILDTIMENRNSNSLTIISTHQIFDVEKLFDEVIFLKEGKIVLHKNTEELLIESNKSLLDLFIEVFRYV
ncbi:MAG: ABC transporter ATP-binding protein [Acholeplasmatales bacterium]|nr:ABC transporter ATP-binding protein [Acholeplasmatales bacterium]